PRQPRELLLRGHFNEASRMLMPMRKDIQEQLARVRDDQELPQKALQARENILKMQAQLIVAQRDGAPNLPQIEAQAEEVWKQNQPWLDAVVEAAAAGPLAQEVN